MKSEVRIGVIGCGGMAQSHMQVFKEIPRVKFTAASDAFAPNLDKVVQTYNVKGFADGDELIASGLCDAVVIATPHYFHPTYAIKAFQHGLHVLTEKPVAVTALAAEEANRVHAKHPKLRLGAMFQSRTVPVWKKVRQILQEGQLGEIRRVQWTITTWFRTQTYYKSGAWRATWAGEGGGVLLNQCPHNLDMLYWLAGRPNRIQAHLGLGRYHDIEVEDDVTAFFQYPNGATGVFITSTGESPGTNFFEIIGDRGKLAVNANRIEMALTDDSINKFCRTSPEMWASPPNNRVTVEAPEGGSHKLIHLNFVAAILDGEPLIAPADEGIHSTEMSNAMIMSGLTGKAVDLPMDRPAYDRMLKKLVKESAAKKVRLLFINQYYWPESAATAQLTDLCEHLAAAGHEVHVLCSRGEYDEGTSHAQPLPAREEHGGVHIRRVRATGFAKRSMLGQAVDFLTFQLACLPRTLLSRRFDVVVTLTTPPLVGLQGVLAKTFRGARHVNWVMDLHPDIEFALGVFNRQGLVPRILDRLNRLELGRADACVALGERMRERLLAKGLEAGRVTVIPIWGHALETTPTEGQPNPLRAELGLEGKFVVMYSGNAGLIHTFDEACTAALALRDDGRFVFLFVGGGRRIAEIQRFAVKNNLTNIRHMGYFPRERLPQSLSLADVHLVTMREGLDGLAVPSKLYGVMAAGRPAIFVGPAACETAVAIQTAGCGRVIANGDHDGLTRVLRELADDRDLCRRLGAAARVPFDTTYNADVCCDQWRRFLDGVGAKPSVG